MRQNSTSFSRYEHVLVSQVITVEDQYPRHDEISSTLCLLSPVQEIDEMESSQSQKHGKDIEYQPLLLLHNIQERVWESTIDLGAMFYPEGIECSK